MRIVLEWQESDELPPKQETRLVSLEMLDQYLVLAHSPIAGWARKSQVFGATTSEIVGQIEAWKENVRINDLRGSLTEIRKMISESEARIRG